MDAPVLAEHASVLLQQLERMRAVEELTDVVLLAEGTPFHCHKVVLSAFSPYFQAMFTCGLKETRGGEVPLRDTPAQSLKLLLDYMYRAELPLSNDNIQGVAAAAFLLHVDGAFRLCQSHMEARMDPSNCVGLYHWARDLGATSLADCAFRFLCQHFAQVCEEEEVLELDAQSLGDLLGSDDLNISEEQVVLELVLRFDRSEENSWVELCSAAHRDMYALGLLGDCLFMIGGQMKTRNHYVITDSVERWSLKRGGSWLSFAPLPLPLACHSVVSLKEHLYVLGGWTPQHQPDDEPDKLSNRMFQFDPSKDRWTERARMKYSRYRCGTAILNGEIYILGGIGCNGEDIGQSRRCLSSVEIYNADTDTWRAGPTLPMALLSLRTNASNLAAVDGKLYLCGYYKGAGRHEIITKEILELDPADNVWTVVERRAAMHDSYDVCLVANLNPRDLITP
ncbi:kelch repeat and BTB domain-containing protein 12-like isoform X2 [Cheilinus undulatus]|uniref:kelch repeat and BTB domain-containing protein 12-like isoform X2 n=1 Tax=Cheilinus undulatus TaxID=241271 RepID=UPI001BD5B341|nr:kelch repeat and BTB domain-containing protein 12-like isoform X2 [Cheilinus undulatus]